ncbi:hypothetical protein HMI55_006204 [Coelomomyces lativittatus]|nr:hypothetical protein HMI55_006204 [Coelomomyces lativittatus]
MSSNTHLSIHSKTKSSKDNVSNSLSAAKNPSTESKSQILQFLSTREPLSYAEHIRLLESELDKNKLKQDAQDYLKQLKVSILKPSHHLFHFLFHFIVFFLT